MNRIYKSIYNATRRCVVCVSEATGSAQGRKGNRVVSESQSLVKLFKKTVLATVVGLLVSGNALAAGDKNDISIGGITYDIVDGEYSVISGGTSGDESWIDSWSIKSYPYTITTLNMIATDFTLYQSLASSGDIGMFRVAGDNAKVIIQGGLARDASAFYSLATEGGDASLDNEGQLLILGSDTGANDGITYVAVGEGSVGRITNQLEGTLLIQGGSYVGSNGINFNAASGGIGTISNDSYGDLTIQGGSDVWAYGIYYNAYDGGTGTIKNTSHGTLTIRGGSSNSGIRDNAYGSGSTGTISNTGSGTLMIQGGADVGTQGIYYNASGSSTGTISNTGSGTLTIQGGATGGAYGIYYNAYEGGSAVISNTRNGSLIIQAGTGSSAYGISNNAYGSGSTGTISNTGTGILTIQGGTSTYASGIYYNANGSDCTGTISNTGSGTLTIQGGTSIFAYGIYRNSNNASKGTINNGENGTLNILGNTDVGSYGIGYLADNSSTSLLENAGVMNLNAYAIEEFISSGTPTSVSVVNKSTGTVNAEAAAIFEQGDVETTVNDPIPITIYTPNEGTKVTELDSYATSETTVTTGWKLKNDWYNYSTWEDGGKLVITDVVAGSTEAQTIIKSFQDRFGMGTTIEFTGTEVNTTSLNRDASEKPAFSMWHVDELIANGEIKNGSVVTSEVLNMTVSDDFGIPDLPEVLSEVNYDPGEYSLVVGDTGEGNLHEYTVSQDIGFKGLVANGDVIVKDGYSFTLLGEQAAMAMALRTTESQATFKLTDSPVTVQADSTLKLGVADLSATQGYFEDLAMTDGSAALSVENGIFQITNVTGNGQINVQEKGQLTIANKASAGDVVNKGVLTANTVNTQIGGTASVATMADGDQNHFETFTNEKGGEANFADVSITEGANVKNKAEGTINAGSVVLNGGAVITNFKDGTLNFDTFEMNGTLRNNGTINVASEMTLAEGTSTTLAGKVTAGTLSIGRAAQKAQAASISPLNEPGTVAEITGETYSNVLDLAGGDVFVRKGAILAGVELKDNIVNSHVTVDTDGTFAFSYNENQLESALKDLKLDTDGKALAVLSTDLSFGEEGSLTVGTTDANATVNLGSDALVLLGTDSLHGNAVLNGEGKETLNIKEGAELAFVDDAIWGNHYLIRDFAQTDDAANLVVKDKDGNVLEAHANDKGIYVTIGSNDITDKDEHFALVGNINSILDGKQDTSSELVDIRYLSQAMGAKDGVKQTNDLQHLSAQAGILSEAYRLTDNAHESIIRHAMSDKYSNVWVEALAGKGGVDGASTAYGDASYDSDSYGMIFGLDGRIGESINVGAAIHYQKGDLDADSSQTKNEFKNYGASIYAGTNFGNLNVTAGITYAKGDHEFNQVNLGYVEGDTDTEIFIGGIRASYPIMVDRILITPYAGIEAVHVKEDGFKATIGGAHAFDFGSVSETFGRVPMGVKLSGGNARFAGYADISVIPQFGNRDAKQSVSGVNTKATDVAKFDYADSVLGRVKMGAAYQVNKSTTLGVSYGASMGDVRDLSHEFSLNAKYRF